MLEDIKSHNNNIKRMNFFVFSLVNLALNKETFEQYPRLIRYNVASNKAVDGKTTVMNNAQFQRQKKQPPGG